MANIKVNRRSWLRGVLTPTALMGVQSTLTPEQAKAAPIDPNDNMKVSKLETFVLKNSWVFVKLTTDTGLVGWGEMLKDDAKACAAGALEVGDYLIGQDRAAWSFTGRPSIAVRSIAAVRSRRRSRAASIRRCGTSPARPTACRSTS